VANDRRDELHGERPEETVATERDGGVHSPREAQLRSSRVEPSLDEESQQDAGFRKCRNRPATVTASTVIYVGRITGATPGADPLLLRAVEGAPVSVITEVVFVKRGRDC
jgi:hypothetical protein